MNILFLTQEYPPETGWGGVGTQKYTMARALAQMGHQVHVLAAAVPPAASYDSYHDGVHVHRLCRWKFEIPLVRRLWFSTLPWTKHQWEYMVTVRRALARLVAAYSIDCIEGVEIWSEGLLYSLQRTAPIIIKLSGPLFMLRALNQRALTLDLRLVERVDQIWTQRADQLTCSSASLAALVADKYKLERQAICVVSNPVDITRFTPSAKDDAQGQTILFSGRLEIGKGVMTLAEAVPMVVRTFPQARFIFVGADKNSMQQQLSELFARANVTENVKFVGHVAYDDIPAYYRSSTVCIVPSYYESFGNVALEAMACGKPVVASNVGGLAEIIRNGQDGLLVPPKDARALANAILTVLGNPTQARDWGRNARKRVESNFSAYAVATRTLNVYSETVARWKRAHHAA
ncbi:glycosyltransferase family 4 protein [Anaerolineae bacterium CFX7]|nr:glycosyltransferase family 4 protein [Anaerolineae bacterium CFX7]RIK24505.1 MAG: hypothetical protein DCC52_12425 [Chloroflexota bacterium]